VQAIYVPPKTPMQQPNLQMLPQPLPQPGLDAL